MIFTEWDMSDGSVCLTPGTDRPRFADGTIIDPDAVPSRTIEANSIEEASAEQDRTISDGDDRPRGTEVILPGGDDF